jgi:hypothetical protein
MWHGHLLDSPFYFDDCQLLVGQVIHHNPDVVAAAKGLGIQRTKDSIVARNGAEVLLNSPAWNFMHDSPRAEVESSGQNADAVQVAPHHRVSIVLNYFRIKVDDDFLKPRIHHHNRKDEHGT